MILQGHKRKPVYNVDTLCRTCKLNFKNDTIYLFFFTHQFYLMCCLVCLRALVWYSRRKLNVVNVKSLYVFLTFYEVATLIKTNFKQ